MGARLFVNDERFTPGTLHLSRCVYLSGGWLLCSCLRFDGEEAPLMASDEIQRGPPHAVLHRHVVIRARIS